MGNTSCTTNAPLPRVLKKEQEDFKVNISKSPNDVHFKKIEVESNYLGQFTLSNFLYILNTSQNELYVEFNKTDKRIKDLTIDPLSSVDGYRQHFEIVFNEKNKNCLDTNSLLHPFSEKMSNLFFNNKIIKNVLLDQNKINDNDMSFFKSFYYKFADTCTTSFKSFCKNVMKVKIKLPKGEDCFPKYYLAGLGFFYCKATNRSKLNLLFNILSNDQSEISSTDYKFRLFLYILLSIPSSLLISSYEKLAQEDEKIREIFPSELGEKLYKSYETNDILRALDLITKDLFGSNEENQIKNLNYEEFKTIFISKGLFWLFNPSGVRSYLEINNID